MTDAEECAEPALALVNRALTASATASPSADRMDGIAEMTAAAAAAARA